MCLPMPPSWFSRLFSLGMKKLSIFMRSHLFILSFMSLALGDIVVKILLCGISDNFLSTFSSRTFMVSQFIFESLSTFKLFFVWCKLGIEFHIFACSCPDLLTLFLKDNIFTPFFSPATIVKY